MGLRHPFVFRTYSTTASADSRHLVKVAETVRADHRLGDAEVRQRSPALQRNTGRLVIKLHARRINCEREHPGKFAWDKYTELRKELIELQKIRAQIIGVKFTLIAAGIALIAGHLKDISPLAFFVPALAAPFFDILVHSYSVSIKRTGYYYRHYLEPLLRTGNVLPQADTFPLWEEFMDESGSREGRFRRLILASTLGTTVLMAVPAIASIVGLEGWKAGAAWVVLSLSWVLVFLLDAHTTITPIRPWKDDADIERQTRALLLSVHRVPGVVIVVLKQAKSLGPFLISQHSTSANDAPGGPACGPLDRVPVSFASPFLPLRHSASSRIGTSTSDFVNPHSLPQSRLQAEERHRVRVPAQQP